MALKNHKELEGTVLSQKMKKTIVVSVKRRFLHSVFKKYILQTKKYYVHDEHQKASVGDIVRVIESKPISKLKRWRLTEVIQKAVQ